MPLEKLGRYEITGKLGEGAMGVVYRAFDPLLERVVAIKTIKLDLEAEDQADFEERFFKEAKSAGRLNHPAIVTVFDAGKGDDVAYIAMELLAGRDLRQLIVKDQLLPVDRVAEIVARVAEGLDYAHKNGVVHRDVKPANIMVLDDGAVKIADFGIAQLQNGAKTMTGQVLGTPKYMSPEQIMGQAVDGRSDIFSLGVVLYQMLTGVSPFDAENVSTVMYRVINEPALMPSLIVRDVPRAFEAILARALAKKPEQRYQTAAEMAAELRRYGEIEDAPDWEGSGLVGGQRRAGAPLDLDIGADATLPDHTRTIRLTAPVAVEDTVRLAPVPAQARRRSRTLAFALGTVILAAGAYAALADRSPSASTVVAASDQGILDLAVTPWGEVFVDGKTAGVSPPLTRLPLPAGRHKLEIRNGDAPPYRLAFELEAGDTRKIKYKFQ